MSVRHRVTCSIPRLAAGALFVCLMVSPIAAQNAAQPAAPAAQATDTSGFERVVLTAGRSTVLNTPFDVTRIAVTNPAVADAVVVQPREVLIDGKSAGTVSLIVWGGDQRRQYDIVVDPGVTTLQQTFQQLFPGEDLRVAMNDESIILTGNVSSNAVMLRAGEIAEGMSSKTSVINLLQLPGGSESQQVMLQVRIAEVNRRAVQELGVNFFIDPSGCDRAGDDAAVPGAGLRRRTRRAGLRRFPQPLLLQPQVKASASRSRRSSRRASSSRSPSRT